jgi:phosphatidylglycerophosphatase A
MKMTRLAVALATVGGLGYSPFAPGTFGSAAGVGVYLLTRGWPLAWQWALLLVITVVGVWASTEAASHFAREDPGPVVIDEVAGQLATFIGIAQASGRPIDAIGILSGFLIFRLLDIVKPWPANRFERLPGGVGIMADDIMAGVYGNLLMRAFTVAVPVLVTGMP